MSLPTESTAIEHDLPEDFALALGDDSIVLGYKGLLDQRVLVALTESLDARLAAQAVPADRIHTVHEVLVEQVQNVLNHGEHNSGTANDALTPGMCLVRHDASGNFEVSTGNRVSEARYHELQRQVEDLNGMTPEQLTGLFQSTGRQGRLRPDSSSRLGLLQMARKSRTPLRIVGRPLRDDAPGYYFILTVQV
ncbi:MAG: SiaB family protein kinase [bacterium]|nr:SiaB family protein kinase [bacterium]